MDGCNPRTLTVADNPGISERGLSPSPQPTLRTATPVAKTQRWGVSDVAAPRPSLDSPSEHSGRPIRTSELDYELPIERIATTPAEPRDSARLMVCSRTEPGIAEHAYVRNVGRFLRQCDLLVLNRTRVVPCRFVGHRPDSGGKVEGLIIGLGEQAGTWRAMLRMRRQKAGVEVAVHDRDGSDSGVRMRLIERSDAGSGAWSVRLTDARPTQAHDGPCEVDGSLWDRVGLTPLPPYIVSARREQGVRVSDEADRERYQTVYAAEARLDTNGGTGTAHSFGSVAAPTAGLHFTPDLLDSLRASGVRFAEVTLHVGLGTFKPVETDWVNDHPMHAEWCVVPEATARAIETARAEGGRVVAVGTTTARTLESFRSTEDMAARGPRGIETRILITPGHLFRHVDALMTNFHLPRSTLLAMVAAFLEADEQGAGVRRLLDLYQQAIDRGYRFYSFGDAMLILPRMSTTPRASA